MPIVKGSYEGHEDVQILEFGTGDIYMTKAVESGVANENILCFSQIPGHKIGDVTYDYEGKPVGELPNLYVVMRFNKPESITALIHSLVELQKSVFQNQKSSQ